MATTIFSNVKDGLNTIFTNALLNTAVVKAIYPYRVYSFDTSPILVITIYDYNRNLEDGAYLIDVGVICAAKFSGQGEAQAAEQVLDDVEQIINDLFDPFNRSEYQVYDGYWGSVDFVQVPSRPDSPFGPGTRYMEKILRINAYGV